MNRLEQALLFLRKAALEEAFPDRRVGMP